MVCDWSNIWYWGLPPLPPPPNQSQRVNLSLDLGRIVWFDLVILHTKFQLSTSPESAIKALDFKLSFRFPPPQEIRLNMGRGGEMKEAYF